VVKTSLTASFLGISACFFDPVGLKVRHVVLDLCHLQHPHTGEILAEHLEQCMQKWSISSNSVLMIVSDNGSNMIKAIRLLNERQLQNEESLQDETSNAMGHEAGDDETMSTDEQESNAGDADDSGSDSSGSVGVGSEEEIDEEQLSDIEQIELADMQDMLYHIQG
jgi:hypothetical protein